MAARAVGLIHDPAGQRLRRRGGRGRRRLLCQHDRAGQDSGGGRQRRGPEGPRYASSHTSSASLWARGSRLQVRGVFCFDHFRVSSAGSNHPHKLPSGAFSLCTCT